MSSGDAASSRPPSAASSSAPAAVRPPRPQATLVESLRAAAEAGGPEAGPIFLKDREAVRVPFAQAYAESRRRAGTLRRLGVEPGERVPLLLPTSPDFLYLLHGLLLAGAVPCPLPPPAGYGASIDFGERTARTIRYLGARRVLTSAAFRDLVAEVLPGIAVLAAEDLAATVGDPGAALEPVAARPDDLALIQCTSGSTGLPKGAMLTHENLLSNTYQIGVALELHAGDVIVCWLPLYHDMGLIGCMLNSIYWGVSGVFLSPLQFLKHPASWLHALARFRGTISPAPNFAYQYVAARVKEAELEGVDLSSWRLAFCGSEPVDPRTLLGFERRFSRWGLPANATRPCYGLAEATLGVSFHPPRVPLEVDRVSREALAERGELEDVGASDAQALEVVNCGSAACLTRVRIVDDDGGEVPAGRHGHVQVSGPSVMKGYFQLPEETAAILRDGWLDTGDMGYVRSSGLRITGRHKDLVIIRGRKYPPSDFEWAADEVAGVRRGNVVAFGTFDAVQGTETLCVLCETELADETQRAALRKAVAERVAAKTGILPAVVELLPKNTVPKTSSGKLQRARMKKLYLAESGKRGGGRA
ncbi:MAG: fatty acyl-AMP ligase [Planctomycetes bacterium]|nr:fatty acyl-AMP ligase [Planctomycetota bacterium]